MRVVVLSIIIPLRANCERPYLLERLISLSGFLTIQDNVEYILVDSGSEKPIRENIKKICDNSNFKYLYQETENRIFSIGRARDYGVQYAKGKLVTFLDVDLVPAPNFEQRIIDLANKIGIIENPKQFFTLPCLYLKEEGNKDFLDASVSRRHNVFYQKYSQGNNQYIEGFAPCSSVMVVNRHHYLSIGGHREEFSGHGYEDFELIHRLLSMQKLFPRPSNYYYDSKSWDNPTYRGFRSLFALLGSQALENELFTVHLWHPRIASSGYESNVLKNHENAILFFKKFDADGVNPLPLSDLSQNKKRNVLFLVEPFSNSMECMREVMPYLGESIFTSKQSYSKKCGKFDTSKFSHFIDSHDIKLIFFSIFHAEEFKYDIYEWVKENKLPFYCFGRGLLPNSLFFDRNGCCLDSSTYSPILWNNVLSKEEKTLVDDYIFSLKKNEKVDGEIRDVKSAVMLLLKEKKVSKELIYRFLYYLIFKVYSFGFFTSSLKKKEKRKNIKFENIVYYKINISKCVNVTFDNDNFSRFKMNDSLFKKRLDSVRGKDSINHLLTKKNKTGVLMFKFLVYPFLSVHKMNKLKNSPYDFFNGSRSIFVRKYGKLIGLIT
jgi:predicted glycosyltransferase involved in capsule biosynthesis